MSECISTPDHVGPGGIYTFCFHETLSGRDIPFVILSSLFAYRKNVAYQTGFLIAVALPGEDFYQVPVIFVGLDDHVALGKSYWDFDHLNIGEFSEFFPKFRH